MVPKVSSGQAPWLSESKNSAGGTRFHSFRANISYDPGTMTIPIAACMFDGLSTWGCLDPPKWLMSFWRPSKPPPPKSAKNKKQAKQLAQRLGLGMSRVACSPKISTCLLPCSSCMSTLHFGCTHTQRFVRNKPSYIYIYICTCIYIYIHTHIMCTHRQSVACLSLCSEFQRALARVASFPWLSHCRTLPRRSGGSEIQRRPFFCCLNLNLNAGG